MFNSDQPSGATYEESSVPQDGSDNNTSQEKPKTEMPKNPVLDRIGRCKVEDKKIVYFSNAQFELDQNASEKEARKFSIIYGPGKLCSVLTRCIEVFHYHAVLC